MTFESPKADWLPLAEGVFDFHQSDEWDDATSEQLLNSMLYRVTMDFPEVEAELTDREITISRNWRGEGQQWSEVIGTYRLGQPFQYEAFLQATPPPEFRKQAEDVIAAFVVKLDRVFRKLLFRGRCSLHARVGSSTARAFTLIPPDVFAHFAITDWTKGAAISSDGEKLFSIYVARSSEPEPEFQFTATPERTTPPTKSQQVKSWIVANNIKRGENTIDGHAAAYLKSRGEEKGKIDPDTVRKAFREIAEDYGEEHRK